MTLLSIPNYSPQAGNLPVLPEGYIGYYESATRQIVFCFGFRERKGRVYLSSERWQPRECSPSRPPLGITPESAEARWLSACWEAALARALTISMENMFTRKRA